jgi:hypothetical protein
MGSPRSPTLAQLAELRQAARLPPPEIHDFDDGELIVSIPPQGLVLVEISSWQPASGAIREIP